MPSPSGIDGKWVLLVDSDPVMARGGDDQNYLLVFKNVSKARQFLLAQEVEGAQPRMVVRGNRDEIVRTALASGATGTLLDYDPSTQQYAEATGLN